MAAGRVLESERGREWKTESGYAEWQKILDPVRWEVAMKFNLYNITHIERYFVNTGQWNNSLLIASKSWPGVETAFSILPPLLLLLPLLLLPVLLPLLLSLPIPLPLPLLPFPPTPSISSGAVYSKCFLLCGGPTADHPAEKKRERGRWRQWHLGRRKRGRWREW